NVLALEEIPNYPLTKVYSQPISRKEIQKFLPRLNKIPEAVEYLESPIEWTSKISHPTQTWTFLENAVIPGAAYTSFRLYQVALQTREIIDYLKIQKTRPDREHAQKLIFEGLEVNDDGEAVDFLKKLRQVLSNAKSTLVEKKRAQEL